MTIQQISVFIENTPGQLTAFAKVLEKNQIDLRALSIAEAENFGILRVIVDDAMAAVTTLKDAGYICSLTPVLAVEIPDKPGSLVKALEALGEADVNLEYMYAFSARKANSAYMIFRVADAAKAVASLGKVGVKTINPDEFEKLFK